jgi:hypothetical protein
MAIGTAPAGEPINLTASGLVTPGVAMARIPGFTGPTSTQAENTTLAGSIIGFYVNSTSSGTLALSKATAAGGAGTSLGTITPAIGWHSYPMASETGIYATIGSTLNVTFFVSG